MSSISQSYSAAGVGVPATLSRDAFQAELSALYALSQRNDYLFGSPLGPFYQRGRAAYVPRFVFFGPHASEDSWRLAFVAGHDHRDLRASRAVLQLARRLAENANDGYGLNLSFFPLVDAAGLFLGESPRPLATADWSRSTLPEIVLLEKDARLRGYHGFIRIESAEAGEEEVTIQVRQPVSSRNTPDVELISTEETAPFPVRFESEPVGTLVLAGPLTIADDLPVSPFELVLRVPAILSDQSYQEAVTGILTRFILRYRAFQAYGQHL